MQKYFLFTALLCLTACSTGYGSHNVLYGEIKSGIEISHRH